MKQIVLVEGSTYFYGNLEFKQHKPKVVNDEVAEVLLERVNGLGKHHFKTFTKKTDEEIKKAEEGLSLKERGDITSEEIRGEAQVASPKVEATVTETADEEEDDSVVESALKSVDFNVGDASDQIKEIKDIQTLMDFTQGDKRKTIEKLRDEMIDKMGATGAELSGEEAVIV